MKRLKTLAVLLVALCCALASKPASAATLTVTDTADTGAGSLRQAIADAAAGDTVNFAPGVTGTIVTTGLAVEQDLTIQGPGAAQLTISGNDVNSILSARDNSLTVSGLTLAHGSFYGGAAIGSFGPLTVTDCIIAHNSSAEDGSASGGAIFSSGGACTFARCTFTANSSDAGGGAIFIEAPSYGAPGPPYPFFASISDCTFTGNTAAGIGGAIFQLNTPLTITNSTFSGNTGASGGALLLNGKASLTSCTITGNSSPNYTGGGISGGNLVSLGNCIVAGNSASSDPDCYGAFTSNDYNLIGDPSGVTFTGATTHNIIGQNPQLGPLQNNGGPTFTCALLAGSPAIDSGDPTITGNDQRGLPRPRDGNGDGIAATDIGAFEVQSTVTLSGHLADGLGNPISGATLTLAGATTLSNGSGNYTFPAVPAGVQRLHPSYPGYSWTPTYRTVGISSANISGQNFTGGLSISGRVTTSGGLAVANVAMQSAAAPVPTNGAGYYTISYLSPGSYTVTPVLAGYSFTPVSHIVALTTASVANVNYSALTTGPYSLSGRIATVTGVSLPNVTVSIAGRPAVTTNSAGYYTFSNLPAETYAVTPTLASYTFTPISLNVVVTTASVSGQNFTGAQGYSVAGRLATSSGLAIAGGSVQLDGGTAVLSNSAGYYTIFNVTNGSHILTPSKAGLTFTPTTRTVQMTGASLAGLNFIGG